MVKLKVGEEISITTRDGDNFKCKVENVEDDYIDFENNNSLTIDKGLPALFIGEKHIGKKVDNIENIN